MLIEINMNNLVCCKDTTSHELESHGDEQRSIRPVHLFFLRVYEIEHSETRNDLEGCRATGMTPVRGLK